MQQKKNKKVENKSIIIVKKQRQINKERDLDLEIVNINTKYIEITMHLFKNVNMISV